MAHTVCTVTNFEEPKWFTTHFFPTLLETFHLSNSKLQSQSRKRPFCRKSLVIVKSTWLSWKWQSLVTSGWIIDAGIHLLMGSFQNETFYRVKQSPLGHLSTHRNCCFLFDRVFIFWWRIIYSYRRPFFSISQRQMHHSCEPSLSSYNNICTYVMLSKN